MKSLPRSLNFRDLGGIAVGDGGRVPHGLYMRSGKLSVLSAEQCEEMCRQHNITCIIDLRTPVEAQEFPDPVPPGVQYMQVPILSDAVVGITHESGSDPLAIMLNLRHHPDQLKQLMPDMGQIYRHMATDPQSRSQIEKVLTTLRDNAAAGRGTLFHCTAGKDRTGVIAMSLLRSLGASDTDIMRDYMRTNRSALWPTVKKCLAILVFTRSLTIARAALDCFLAHRRLASIYLHNT